MKREIAKSRPESRPRPRHRRDFFLGFMFEHRNRRELSNFAHTRSRREDFSSVRDPARSLSRPIHTPPISPPPKESLFGVFPCTLSRTCGDHMVTPHQLVCLCVVVLLAEGAIFQGALFSRDLFLMHKCLNRDHHSCDKPLKAKVFFILYPSRGV